jgi:hypothetical protein
MSVYTPELKDRGMMAPWGGTHGKVRAAVAAALHASAADRVAGHDTDPPKLLRPLLDADANTPVAMCGKICV